MMTIYTLRLPESQECFQKHHVTLRERIPRPKSLVFLELETLRYAQGDIFEMGSEETKELKIFLGFANLSTLL